MPARVHLALESLAEAQLGEPEAGEAAVASARGSPETRGARRARRGWALGHSALARKLRRRLRGSSRRRLRARGDRGARRAPVRRRPGRGARRARATRRGRRAARLVRGNASRLERVSALASCARCRGLLARRRGSLEARSRIEEALEWHAKVELPLERADAARARRCQRRAKRRREARETLEEALAVFERIGAALWAERARAELKRISGRAATPARSRPLRSASPPRRRGQDEPRGRGALFLSDRTVEGHLSHIFGKLGIRHRRDRPAARARQTQGVAASNTGDSPRFGRLRAP